jgi:hypothetical protein
MPINPIELILYHKKFPFEAKGFIIMCQVKFPPPRALKEPP